MCPTCVLGAGDVVNRSKENHRSYGTTFQRRRPINKHAIEVNDGQAGKACRMR